MTDNTTNFTITVDGHEVACRPGWSIAAALMADGRTAWRTTRGSGRPRGLFCGIGICHDCLVTVNGIDSLRACLVPALEGDDVRTEGGNRS